MKLRYTPEALRDLQEIKRYIKSELHNPTAANRITKAILDGCAVADGVCEPVCSGGVLELAFAGPVDLRMGA